MIVFDLDGTLSNHHWRYALHIAGGKRDYDAYHAVLGMDSPIPWMVGVFWAMRNSSGALVEFWTGRPEQYRAATEGWITEFLFNGNSAWLRKGLFHTNLRMRPDGDSRPNAELKRDWVRLCAKEGKPVRLAFEDMETTAKMYREEGVQCLLVLPTF